MRWHHIITLPLEAFLSLVAWALDRIQGWPKQRKP